MTFWHSLRLLLLSSLAALVCWLWMPDASALVPVELSDLSYRECADEVGEGMVLSGSVNAANCFIVTGKATNTSGKPVVNADIFGRIYDANHNNVLPNRNRLGAIDYVPPGDSEFELRISVPANQPLPLELSKFKASGFTGRVRR